MWERRATREDGKEDEERDEERDEKRGEGQRRETYEVFGRKLRDGFVFLGD